MMRRLFQFKREEDESWGVSKCTRTTRFARTLWTRNRSYLFLSEVMAEGPVEDCGMGL